MSRRLSALLALATLFVWFASAAIEPRRNQLHFNYNPSALDSVLQQLDSLDLNLRSSEDEENNLVKYLLHQQQHCTVRISILSKTPSQLGLSGRHHLVLYERLSKLISENVISFNRESFFVIVLEEEPLQIEFRRFARTLWKERSVYQVYYMLPQRMLSFNPFAIDELDKQFGSFFDISQVATLDIFHNLNGYMLRIYIFASVYSSVYGDAETKRIIRTTGADSKVAELMSRKMNFSIDFQWPDDQYFGARLSNGSFNGAIGRILRNEIDLIFSGFFVKDYLTRDIEFSVAVYMDELCCFVQKAKRIPQSILPFFAVHLDVWLGFFFVGFISAFMWICIRILNTFFNISRITKQSFVSLPATKLAQGARIFVDTWIVWVRVNLNRMPPFHSERVFVISLSLVSVIFGALFESSLATVYIRPLYYNDINTLRELDAANIPIYIKHPAFKDDLFYGQGSELYKNLDNKMLLVAEGDERLLDMVTKRGGFAGVTRSASLNLNDIRYIMTKKVHKIPECPKNYHIAYVMQKSSPYLVPMNLLLLRMKEAGLIDYWIGEMLQSAKLSINNFPDYLAELGDKVKILTLNDVQLAFYALCLGCMLAAIVLLGEMAIKFYSKNKHFKIDWTE